MKKICKMIVSCAPARLLKLQFKRVEAQLRSEMKKADAEITEECAAVNQNKDFREILKRHEAKFRRNDFHSICESHLESLRAIIANLKEIKPDDASNFQQVFDHIQNYWFNLTQKIDSIFAKLTMLPNAKQNYERNLAQFDVWLCELEITVKALLANNFGSITDYRNILDKAKVGTCLHKNVKIQ